MSEMDSTVAAACPPRTAGAPPGYDRSLRRAIADLSDGVRRWPLWWSLANSDILLRYRRSLLGPLWITVSMAIMIGALSASYSLILHVAFRVYLPYVASGLIVWGFISSCIGDSCSIFIGNAGMIRLLALPKSALIYRCLWRNIVILAHNMVALLLCGPLMGLTLDWMMVGVLPGFFLLVMNLTWMMLLLAILCARFRDVMQIVGCILQITFLVTPILWKVEPGSVLAEVSACNPIYLLIEIIRSPLLGHWPSASAWQGTLVCAAAGWAVTLVLFARYRWRISYWV